MSPKDHPPALTSPSESEHAELRNSAKESFLPLESETLHHYLQQATSENTRKAYRSAIRQFEKWGGRLPTNRDTLIRYLLTRADSLNTRTLDLHLTAISQWHNYQGILDPVRDPLVRKTMEGIRRTHAKPKRKAKPLRLEHIAQLLSHLSALPASQKKLRDIALILTGFFGAFRRSELVAIQLEDLMWEPEGLAISLPRSKTDQSAQGLVRALPYGVTGCCPVKATRDWIDTAGISEGPLFRPVNRWDQVQSRSMNPGAINELLKNLGTACGFDFVPDLSSHSFRRGLSTSAARDGVDFESIKKQGGWRSDETVREYIEEGQRFSNNAAGALLDKMSELLKP